MTISVAQRIEQGLGGEGVVKQCGKLCLWWAKCRGRARQGEGQSHYQLLCEDYCHWSCEFGQGSGTRLTKCKQPELGQCGTPLSSLPVWVWVCVSLPDIKVSPRNGNGNANSRRPSKSKSWAGLSWEQQQQQPKWRTEIVKFVTFCFVLRVASQIFAQHLYGN